MDGYEVKRYPRARRVVTDAGWLHHRRHTIRGLVECDLTDVRPRLRSDGLSMTAYLAACAGRAVAEHPDVHAHKDWRGRLVVHRDVDVLVMVETTVEGTVMAVGHILREANLRSVADVSAELRSTQHNPADGPTGRMLRAGVRLPTPLRRAVLWAVTRSVRWSRRLRGTIVITSVGMFFDGAGWGFGLPSHPLGITVGGIGLKPRVVDGEVVAREVLDVTLEFDHDIVDGAPAARFARRFTELVESGTLLAA